MEQGTKIRLASRARLIESSGIRRVFDLGASLKNPYNFSIGQPDFPVPEEVREAAKRAIDEGKNGYTPTQGIGPLRAKVAQKLAKKNNISVSEDDVLITSGSSGGIFLAFSALLDPGDEVIVPDPYFVMYPELAKFLGVRAITVDTYPDFQLDPERLKAAITPRTRAIVINSPNNPTGSVYSEATLREVARVADEAGGIPIISDEVYEPFVYDGEMHFSVGSIYPNTITLNAFSKSHALTGWRIGYAAGPAVVIDKMKELQQYTFVCAPSFAQVAALTALSLDPKASVSVYSKRRDLMYAGLRERFEVTLPKGAFYMMAKVDEIDATEFFERAIEKNVLVIPGGVFSGRKTHIRLSFATSEEKIIGGTKLLSEL